MLAAFVLDVEWWDRYEHWVGRLDLAGQKTADGRTGGDTCSVEPSLQSDRSIEGWGSSSKKGSDAELEHQPRSWRSWRLHQQQHESVELDENAVAADEGYYSG